jgi:hypothetical protein
MLDVLQLGINPDEFEQIRLCQIKPRADCHAAFTVRGPEMIWPVASWGDTATDERINVRGWFPVLDQMADEFLLWWPQGGCFFVAQDRVTYRLHEHDANGVLFLQLEVKRLKIVPQPPRNTEAKPLSLVPRFISRWG